MSTALIAAVQVRVPPVQTFRLAHKTGRVLQPGRVFDKVTGQNGARIDLEFLFRRPVSFSRLLRIRHVPGSSGPFIARLAHFERRARNEQVSPARPPGRLFFLLPRHGKRATLSRRSLDSLAGPPRVDSRIGTDLACVVLFGTND